MSNNTDRSECLSNKSVHTDGSNRAKMSVKAKEYKINNRFCYYWSPIDDRDRKDVIIIEDNVKGYYTTTYPRMTKNQIMEMNHNIGLKDNEVYEICQCNCKIMFSNEPTGVFEKLQNRSGHK
tara:strand:- start:143 stop:508 length:366 start_codon:yes stop_codon:yes gene_type:complete